MLGYVLGLWARAALFGIFIYFIFHFVRAFCKYRKKPSCQNRGLCFIALLAGAYSLGRVVGFVQCVMEAITDLFFKTKESK